MGTSTNYFEVMAFHRERKAHGLVDSFIVDRPEIWIIILMTEMVVYDMNVADAVDGPLMHHHQRNPIRSKISKIRRIDSKNHGVATIAVENRKNQRIKIKPVKRNPIHCN